MVCEASPILERHSFAQSIIIWGHTSPIVSFRHDSDHLNLGGFLRKNIKHGLLFLLILFLFFLAFYVCCCFGINFKSMIILRFSFEICYSILRGRRGKLVCLILGGLALLNLFLFSVFMYVYIYILRK